MTSSDAIHVIRNFKKPFKKKNCCYVVFAQSAKTTQQHTISLKFRIADAILSAKPL